MCVDIEGGVGTGAVEDVGGHQHAHEERGEGKAIGGGVANDCALKRPDDPQEGTEELVHWLEVRVCVERKEAHAQWKDESCDGEMPRETPVGHGEGGKASHCCGSCSVSGKGNRNYVRVIIVMNPL